jgi:hypothetical protein
VCDPAFPDYPKHRAYLNRTIKNMVLDDGLPDVVLYLGAYRHAMRELVTQGLCKALSDRNDAGVCDPRQISPAALSNDQLVLFTHSLGSRMLLDTMYEWIKPESESVAADPPAATRQAMRLAIQAAFTRDTPFYMLANQFELLNLVDSVRFIDVPTHEGTEKSYSAPFDATARVSAATDHPFFQALAGNRRDLNSTQKTPSVRIVAVTDPNDDLSFMMPKYPYGLKGLSVHNC